MQMAPMALMAGGKLVEGIAGLRAGKQQNKVLKAQARDTIATGNAQALQARDSARKAIGEQVAAQFGNGFLGGTGSALDYLHESQVNAALDALEIRRQAENKAASLRYEGKLRVQEGRNALSGALLGAASSMASAGADWASARAPS